MLLRIETVSVHTSSDRDQFASSTRYSLLDYNLSLERIADSFNCCPNGFFRSGTFDGEGVGRGTGLGILYAGQFFDGTNTCSTPAIRNPNSKIVLSDIVLDVTLI